MFGGYRANSKNERPNYALNRTRTTGCEKSAAGYLFPHFAAAEMLYNIKDNFGGLLGAG
jgi:hypothetical protein